MSQMIVHNNPNRSNFMTAAHTAGDTERNHVLSSTRRDQQDADQERLLLVLSEFSWSSPISPSEWRLSLQHGAG